MNTLIHKQLNLSKKICSLYEDQKIKILNTPHVQAVGSTMYPILCTIPDISFIVSLVFFERRVYYLNVKVWRE